jgi:serine/threonine protein kinase
MPFPEVPPQSGSSWKSDSGAAPPRSPFDEVPEPPEGAGTLFASVAEGQEGAGAAVEERSRNPPALPFRCSRAFGTLGTEMLTKLGPYRLLSRIAKGGMAETFVAERSEAAGAFQRVCLKRLLGEDEHDAAWITMFQREAQMVSALLHPNVVRLQGFGEADGIWYMALELVVGLDLRELLVEQRASGHRLPIDIVVTIATQIAYGLAHAHESGLGDDGSGVVHRDVSPSNILVSYYGEVKLTDFGIAKVQRKEAKTRSGHIKGKEAYMSPEQGMALHLDGRADLFALGVVMFEMLAGVGPYEGETSLATTFNLLQGKRVNHLNERAPEVPPALVAIVHSLVEFDRDNRIASAAELVRQLDDLGAWQMSTRRLASIVRAARPRVEVPPEGQLTSLELPRR